MIEVALLQPARPLVEVDEAGGQPGDHVLRLRELVDGAEALLDDLARSPTKPARMRCSAMSKMAFSARSRTTAASSSAS